MDRITELELRMRVLEAALASHLTDMDRITELEMRMRALEAALASHLVEHTETSREPVSENALIPEETE